MRREELHWAIPAHPFHPFVLHLAGGRKFFVNQPEFLSFGYSRRPALVLDVDGSGANTGRDGSQGTVPIFAAPATAPHEDA